MAADEPASERDAAVPTAERRVVRIGLVGCVKTKLDHAAPARDLYVSPMFRGRRTYVERTCDRWFVISALYGLVDPDAVIEPYNVTLKDASEAERRQWSTGVLRALESELGTLAGKDFELHAGSSYLVHGLASGLRAAGASVITPTAGLTFGQQLAFYSRGGGEPPAIEPSPGPAPKSLSVLDAVPIGPFEFTWWADGGIERYDHGWNLSVLFEGSNLDVRHGVGSRDAYGQARPRSVTWVNGDPTVEGVGADDYQNSLSLLTIVKRPDGKHVQSRSELPEDYLGFDVVVFNHEIRAPRSPASLAVKVHQDDYEAWVYLALLRIAQRRRPGDRKRPMAGRRVTQASTTSGRSVAGPSSVGSIPVVSDETRGAVAAALLAHAAALKELPQEDEPKVSDDPAADRLLRSNPFAFLLGVLFDQQITAERAWRAPYELSLRLGHLDPSRMLLEPDAVREAVARPTALHRYVQILPEWILSAARRVVSDYGGDASRIWNDEPTAAELQRRFDAFAGIGQKKAAMAVEILERDLGVPVRDMHGSDIAYDIHVRRVFLRTGLADVDDSNHMVARARELHPERPGALDIPAWYVGRNWCHAGVPNCSACPLHTLCPKLIDRAGSVISI